MKLGLAMGAILIIVTYLTMNRVFEAAMIAARS